MNFISLARKEYDNIAKKEVQKKRLSIHMKNLLKTLMDNYLDNVEAYCNKAKLRDPLTGEEMSPDEKAYAFN
ncbi:hypothetical protein GCM10020331_088650 [Ectobacillus funiculus]